MINGLDNAGWAIDATIGSEGVLSDDGFEFVADSVFVGGMVTQQRINKRLVGQGSFLEEVRFKDLSLGEITEASAFGTERVIILHHFFSVGDLSSRVAVWLREPIEPDDVWQFILVAPESKAVQSLVPRSDDLVLSLAYDQQSSTYSARYEPNVFDGEPATELTFLSST